MTHKKRIAVFTVLLVFVLLCMEIRPASVVASTIFSTGEQVENRLYVVVNKLGVIKEEKMVREILREHQAVNGRKENEYFTMVLYRTMIHYRTNKEYKTISCDKNGMIIR